MKLFRDTPSPGNKALGASNEPHYAYIFGDFLGNELRKIGFNMLFAPVLDVRANKSSPVVGLRSFSDNPKIVAEYGVNFLKGLNNHIIGTCKHFPGHGKAMQDSHHEIPIIPNLMKVTCSVYESYRSWSRSYNDCAYYLPTIDDNITQLYQNNLKNLLRERWLSRTNHN